MSSISLGKGQFVTSIKIYARGRRAGSPGTLPISFSFSWRIGSGAYSVSKSLKYENTNFYWLSTSYWTGLNLTQSDINNLRVRIRIIGTNPVDKELHLSVMYVQLTVMSNEAPTVNIISPNGGETLQNSTLITWAYNDPENQRMRFNLYHNATGTGWTPIVSNLINKTSYLWNLSSFTQRYYNVSIKIEAFDFYNSSDEDISDGTFTIFVNHAPTVTVTAPNGGEVLENSTLITWNSNDLDGDAMSYNISYYIEGSGWFPLVSNLQNASSYFWNLSSFTERKEKVLVKIVAFDEYNGSSEDISDDFFSIFVNHAPSVTITAPDGGEVLENSTLITWTFTDLDNDTLRFNISYYVEGLGWYSLVSNLYNVSSYHWNLSSFTKRQEKVLIKIVAFDAYNGTSEDVSKDFFSIFVNHAPVLVLTYPYGGEIIKKNSLIIRWNCTDPDGDLVYYNIYYCIRNGTWILIVEHLSNQTSYIWDISEFAGKTLFLKVKIVAIDQYNSTSVDISEEYFLIDVSMPPSFDSVTIIVIIGSSSALISLIIIYFVKKKKSEVSK